MLHAMLKQNMPRLTCLFANGIWVKWNITKFISEMNMVDWQFVLTETDTQSAYSKFYEVISTKYNVCFPYRKISKKYYKNKPWLSTALKESIKIKKL